MNNKEIIKNILIEELSKCNNFNYYFYIGQLNLIVNTKKPYQILVDNSSQFEGGINSKCIFEKFENKKIYLSYYDIWSKIEKKTELKYIEIQSIVKYILEDNFKIKGIIPRWMILEESFKIKGITPRLVWFGTAMNFEESFKLKGIFSIK